MLNLILFVYSLFENPIFCLILGVVIGFAIGKWWHSY